MENTLISLHDLEIRAAQAEVVTWQGREALRLENGLALAPEGGVKDASIEVLIGTAGPAYPGVAFRVADVVNFELAYAVPHVSGEWDALQYDPVFHGSNTWQLHHGPGYQREAEVPTGRWFRLKVDYCGSRAAVSVDGQSLLVVVNLNRYLPTSMGKARLVRRFETSEEGEITLEFGFSDVLSLELDGEVLYRGENTFGGFADRAARGYVELGMESVRQVLATGSHCLAAELEVSEGFGWGLVLAARGEGLRPEPVEGLRWLPVELG